MSQNIIHHRVSILTLAILMALVVLASYLLCAEVGQARGERPTMDERGLDRSDMATDRAQAEPTEPNEAPEPEAPTSNTPPTPPEPNLMVAAAKPAATGLQLKLHELGLLQLAAHDFFNVDRDTEIDSENGDLDLSTLLDHGEENIPLGGEPRNRENIFIFSVAKDFADLYYHHINNGKSEYQAREATVKYYHNELKKVFKKIFGENLPQPKEGTVTMTENVALRTIHDFLPGTIVFEGETVLTVDHALFGKTLSQRELKQMTSPLDGQFDEEFLDVVIFIPPDRIMHIDLFERDSSFAVQFNSEHSFEHFMSELEDGSYDEDEDVTHHIKTLFAKGLYFDN